MADLQASSFGLPSEEVWKSYLILPKFGAWLSIVASTLLARDVHRKWRAKKAVPLNNILLFGISAVNIAGAFFSWFMTSWMVPKGDAPYAAGNQATCNAQGVFVSFQFIYFVSTYTGLAALYWLVVDRSWKEGYMKQLKIRLTFLLPPIAISLLFAIVPLFYDMYNIAIVFCYLAPYPPGCDIDPDAECTRGGKARMVQTAAFAYTMACNVAIVVFISLLVRSVLRQERKGDQYLAAGQSASRTHTKKTARQGLRYVGAFTLAYFCVYVFMVWNVASKARGTVFTVLFYFHVILNPLCGLFNALVYFHPRYDSYREQHPEKSSVDCMCHVLNIDVPRCNIKWRGNRPEAQPTESTLVSPLIQGIEEL